MPSTSIVESIDQSLVPGERYEDFERMFDIYSDLKQRLLGSMSLEQVEGLTGLAICVLSPLKSGRNSFVISMQRFRLLHQGIANDPELQAIYLNSVERYGLLLESVESPSDVVFKPSLFFDASHILRHRELSWEEALPHWFSVSALQQTTTM